jgi:hypothetical protein
MLSIRELQPKKSFSNIRRWRFPTFTQRLATTCSTEVPLTAICKSVSRNMIEFANSTNRDPILPAFANVS